MNTIRELSLDRLSSDSMSSPRGPALMDPINPCELSRDGGWKRVMCGCRHVSLLEGKRGGGEQEWWEGWWYRNLLLPELSRQFTQ